jgi:pantoate--beta-alanine ligase
MFIFKSADLLHAELNRRKKLGHSIGFIPTMGALHLGHQSLVERARVENDTVVCSIFVNPKQFDEKMDLDNYPNPIQQDLAKLSTNNVDIVFHPEVDQIYHSGYDDTDIDMNGIDLIHEGAHRPGHFQGVAKVVKRFFEIIQPTNTYFGQKDFQQTVVVDFLIKAFKMDINLVVCPIVREANGLAMSSRNERLATDKRDKASFIYKSLIKFKERCFFKLIPEAKATTVKYLNSIDGAVLDYFVIADGETLQEVNHLDDSKYIVAKTVVRYDGVRLLDNVILKDERKARPKVGKP